MKKAAAKKASKAPANAPSAVSLPVAKSQVVLLAVTGMTPAVLTETIWALAHEQPPVIPDRVVAVTTPRGKELMERELFSAASAGAPDLWQMLRREILGDKNPNDQRLNLEPFRLICAPNARTGRSEALEDFRTSDENAAMADFVLEQVRGFVEAPGVQLITSIAGGRKTLGALLYACMSLMGRETDRLTHVLVNEPFDNPRLFPRFFFPNQPLQQLKTEEGKIVTAKEASIDLGDIPFVPLRNLFERDLIRKPHSFTELVERCRLKVKEAASRNVTLTIWRRRREMEVSGVRVHTSTSQQLLMLFLAEPSMSATRNQITKFDTAIEPLRAFSRKVHAERLADDYSDWRGEAALSNGFGAENLRKVLNELKGKLRAAGDEASALIPLLPIKGRFSLDLAPTSVTVED